MTATLPAIRQIETAAATSTTAPTMPGPTATTAFATETTQPSPTSTSLPTFTPSTQPSSTASATLQPTELPPTAAESPPAAESSPVTLSPAEANPPSMTSVSTAVPPPVAEPSPTNAPLDASFDAIDPATVNGVPVAEIAIMSANVRENVRRIFLRGQQIGRNAHVFSKLGDSVTVTDHYLSRFDSGGYDLGPYAYLQPAIDYYRGSFSRHGVATRVGLHAWSLFDPLWADKEHCLPDEHMVACEIRLNNPSVLLIKIGSNDSGPGSVFEENLRLLLDYAIDNGVIPILATKADRFEGADDRNNTIIRNLAQAYAIPLWDYDRVAGTLPRRGLSGDYVHMTMADADDYTNPETFERGYPVADLTALMTLYEVMREVGAAGGA